MIESGVIKEIIDKYRAIWSLSHALSLLSWDTETYMPRKGIEERSIAVGELATLRHKLLIDDELSKIVEKADSVEGLNDFERGVIRVVKRQIRIAKALPEWLVREFAKVTQKAKVVWKESKEKDDFKKFEPYLEKIVDLSIKRAEYLGYDDEPYDALLDLYEEGLKTKEVRRLFSYIEPRIKKVLDMVLSDEYFPREHKLENSKYSVNALRKLNIEILNMFGYPPDKARLDISAHPFTINMGINDVRITTRYEGYDFKRSLLAVIHEFGHALYELQIEEALKTTPLATGVSLGIHESQSRFWENMIGRSREFIEATYPLVKNRLKFLKEYSVEDIYKYFNVVKPSYIRTEADEVTYNMHILLRFKIEVQLLNKEVNTTDIPEIWNQEMESLLGIKPSTYRDGVLQDIHWSMGAIGYFPTYTLGNIISAQIFYHITNEISSFFEKISNLKFDEIKLYLKEKIHKWGSTFQPKELIKRSFGEQINAQYFIKYLEDKYVNH